MATKTPEPALLTENEVLKLLRIEVAKAGNQKGWAIRRGVDRTTVNAILQGRRRLQPKLLQDLWRDLPRGMTRPLGQKPEGSKADRMVAQSAKIEAGHVHLPKEADWLDTFLHELHSRLASDIRGQMRLDTGPLLVAQPEPIPSHEFESFPRTNHYRIV